MKMIKLLYLLPLVFLISSCTAEESPLEDQMVEGLKPIYSTGDDWKNIKTIAPQPIKKLGKIYYKDNKIFVNEFFKGIHIIDNSDPTNPIKLKFIEILGNKDIAIKGQILYADNVTDLVTLDISNLDDIKVLGRVKDIYPNSSSSQTNPEGHIGPFECVDPSKGTVIGWEEATLLNPDCRGI